MKGMKLSQLSKIVQGSLKGDDSLFESISIDTRTLKKNACYIAIKGNQFDGHAFVNAAKQAGATAVIVDHAVDIELPQIIVNDTLNALSQFAAYHRSKINIPLIGITGSCGKTSAKAILAAILELRGKVCASQGTFNNHIGVPLTLLTLTEQHDYAVIEMGANHLGEIAELTRIARPDVAIITGIEPVHLEGFGSMENIVKAKSEIFQGLPGNGVAIINADNQYANDVAKHVGQHKLIRFAIDSDKADIKANHLEFDNNGHARFILITGGGEIAIHLPLLGKHHVYNALAAAAAAVTIDIPLATIKEGLESVQAVGQRLVEYKGRTGEMIIDDSYNANPASTKAALEVLIQKPGELVFVFGDMLELGPDEKLFHQTIGQHARELGIKQLFAYGNLAKYTAEAFGDGASFYETQLDLIRDLQKVVHKDMSVLVKGSNSMKMWQIVQALLPEEEN